jgi:hypothetical protein
MPHDCVVWSVVSLVACSAVYCINITLAGWLVLEQLELGTLGPQTLHGHSDSCCSHDTHAGQPAMACNQRASSYQHTPHHHAQLPSAPARTSYSRTVQYSTTGSHSKAAITVTATSRGVACMQNTTRTTRRHACEVKSQSTCR